MSEAFAMPSIVAVVVPTTEIEYRRLAQPPLQVSERFRSSVWEGRARLVRLLCFDSC
jgi:hypothetical protein